MVIAEQRRGRLIEADGVEYTWDSLDRIATRDTTA
jgi:hypothetical protein